MPAQVRVQAPDFTAKAVVNGNIVNEYKLSSNRGKYVVLFFYPLDFTFVCPTEIIAFSDRIADFEKRNCQVIGCSVDSEFAHLAWIEQPIHDPPTVGAMAAKLNWSLSHFAARFQQDFGLPPARYVQNVTIVSRKAKPMEIAPIRPRKTRRAGPMTVPLAAFA